MAIGLLDDDVEAPVAPPLPDRYEVVHGEIVEKEPMSAYSSLVAQRINAELVVYGRTTGLGESWVEMLYRLPTGDDETRNRRIDVAFVTARRYPKTSRLTLRVNPIDVVPDVAIEVISPTDIAYDVIDRTHEYLRAGIRLVWVIYPQVQQIFAYTDPHLVPRLYQATNVLDGGEILPGFRTPVGELFPPIDA